MRRRHCLDPRPQLRVDAQLHVITAVTGHRRAGPVRRQRHHLGQISQLLTPIGQLRGNHTVGIRLGPQPILLPQRVIRILHRQRRPLRSQGLPPRLDTPRRHHGPSGPVTTRQKRCGATRSRAHTPQAPPNKSARESGSRSTSRTDTPPAPPTRRPHRTPTPTTTAAPPRRHIPASAGTTFWTGTPSMSGNVVRSDSWRAITSSRAASSASTSSAPLIRNAAGYVVGGNPALEPVAEPHPALGERQRHHRGSHNRHQRRTPRRILTDAGRQLGDRGRLE